MKLFFYTRKNCSLCRKGFEILQEVRREFAFEIEKRDIDTHDEWLETYQLRIPVVVLNGKELDEGRLSKEKLLARLSDFQTDR